jgi:MAE_28990/MAE_18760-like HEPN
MDFDAIRAELEQDLAWRLDEIRFLQNQGSSLGRDDGRRYRRALILILYSHFEGFCKFAFLHYIRILNSTGVKCSDANHALAAATLAMAFQGLRDTQRRNTLYQHKLPDDPVLHRFAREREFLERLDEFESQILDIPDEVVSLEANLKPDVLRVALYRLGLDPAQFDDVYAEIGQLVGLRNNIAHGATRSGVDVTLYESYEKAALRVMNKIADDVMEALRNRALLYPRLRFRRRCFRRYLAPPLEHLVGVHVVPPRNNRN